MAGGWSAAFEEAGAGTRIRFAASMEPGGLMALMTPVLRPWARKQTRTFLTSFKSWAEAG
jgi:carbon monoxide dehydrogenase subunit G